MERLLTAIANCIYFALISDTEKKEYLHGLLSWNTCLAARKSLVVATIALTPGHHEPA